MKRKFYSSMSLSFNPKATKQSLLHDMLHAVDCGAKTSSQWDSLFGGNLTLWFKQNYPMISHYVFEKLLLTPLEQGLLGYKTTNDGGITPNLWHIIDHKIRLKCVLQCVPSHHKPLPHSLLALIVLQVHCWRPCWWSISVVSKFYVSLQLQIIRDHFTIWCTKPGQ